MARRVPRRPPEVAAAEHQRESFGGAERGRSSVPLPVSRDSKVLARLRSGAANRLETVRAYQDTFTLAGGAETVELTYLPLTFSEHVYMNGVYQREGESYDWTRDSGTRNVNVLTPMDARAGDILIVEYLYYAGVTAAPTDSTPSNADLVNFGTGASGASSVSPSLPAGVSNGDLLLLSIVTRTNTTPTGTSGWTLVAASDYASYPSGWTDTSKTFVYQRTYNSGSYSTPSLGGSDLVAQITAFSDATVASSATWDSGSDTSPYSIDGVTTAGPNRRVFFAIGGGDDLSIAPVSNSNLTSLQSNYLTYNAGSAVLAWATGLAEDAGSIGPTTFGSLAFSCTAVTVVIQ